MSDQSRYDGRSRVLKSIGLAAIEDVEYTHNVTGNTIIIQEISSFPNICHGRLETLDYIKYSKVSSTFMKISRYKVLLEIICNSAPYATCTLNNECLSVICRLWRDKYLRAVCARTVIVIICISNEYKVVRKLTCPRITRESI